MAVLQTPIMHHSIFSYLHSLVAVYFYVLEELCTGARIFSTLVLCVLGVVSRERE